MGWQSLKMLLWMVLITGIVYPVLITLIAQLTMPFHANGSLVMVNHKVIGSQLIGQKFESDKYFWGRPSASGYDPLFSGGSNLGQISRKLKTLVEERREYLLKANIGSSGIIPSDLLYASGSGLDPHLTIEAVQFQKARIVKSRGGGESFDAKLQEKIDNLVERKKFGFIGVPYINVLELNIALDEI